MLFRPGLRSKSQRWWPTPPKPTGGTQIWEPSEAEVKWLATGKGIRKKSTDTHIVCAGGPYHNEKILSRFDKKTGRERHALAVLPRIFACPPYAGHYELEENEDPTLRRYIWRG